MIKIQKFLKNINLLFCFFIRYIAAHYSCGTSLLFYATSFK